MFMVQTINDFVFDSSCKEKIRGISQTVPNEATSLKELVRRSHLMAQLPDIYHQMEQGPDDDFDDAIDNERQDLVDYVENKEYIVRVREKLEELKKSAKAEKTPSAPISTPDPIENPSDSESV